MKTLGVCAAIAVVAVSLGVVGHVYMPGQAKAVISGPTTAQVGEPLEFDASSSNGDLFDWSVYPQVRFKVQNGGSQIVFAPMVPATYQVKCDVTAMAPIGRHRLTKHSITTSVVVSLLPPAPGPGPGPNPTPVPPGPGPGPTPGPNLPDGKYKLARFVYDSVNTRISGPAKAIEAHKLSDVFKSIAAGCDAGKYRSSIAVAQDIVKQVKEALGSSKTAWDGVLADIRAKIMANFTTSSTPQEVGVAIKEVAAGLEAVQ
jgi:hypothetical protein